MIGGYGIGHCGIVKITAKGILSKVVELERI